jgi:hypothetical protein
MIKVVQFVVLACPTGVISYGHDDAARRGRAAI